MNSSATADSSVRNSVGKPVSVMPAADRELLDAADARMDQSDELRMMGKAVFLEAHKLTIKVGLYVRL